MPMLGGKWLPWMLLRVRNRFYPGMTLEAQAAVISQLKPHTKNSFLEPAIFEPWHEMLSRYLFCE
ncbi:alpha/beta-hydrolase [Penicillium canariense]|uniref:Alpha/beta-hydrolase n=1 Tax=Penicillium canariense TaxID=189055 RepID=A0A9W9IHR3_9EURO|nr:alpha/beta-hydrolase [Penicillium canariense]KAJ5176519.1 alpha/beta-hydrolase [Penicillium canariense]